MIVLEKQEIESLIDLNQMMDQIEEAYRIFGEGDYYMPPRQAVEDANKTMMYMPCYTKEMIGTKILSIFPDNAKLGLPSIDGVMLLNDYQAAGPTGWTDGYRMEDRCRGRRGNPASGGKGQPYGGHYRRGSAGISPGALCMRGQGYPYCVRL